MSQDPNPNNTPVPVPIPTAQAQTLAWRDFMASITPDPNQIKDRVNGYFIPLGDIQSILNLAQNGVRAYFALRETGNGAQGKVHMYIVPVDADGNDIIEVQGNSVVYDTTLPCPAMCGTGNVLNGGL